MSGSNSEKRPQNPVLTVDQPRCIRCGACIRQCRQNALRMKQKDLAWDGELCGGCGACVMACVSKALKLEISS
jgi:anaerobic sulfite reductase subunit C